MRRIPLAVASTAGGLTLLFSYHTSTSGPSALPQALAGAAAAGTAPAPSTPAATTTPSTATPTSPGATARTTPTTTPAAPSSAAGATTFDGAAVDTRWGIVQVRITVAGSKLADVVAVQVPSENPKDQRINAVAVPILRRAALAAQSAKIDTVSGATVTSNGYIASLQAALDAAHLQTP